MKGCTEADCLYSSIASAPQALILTLGSDTGGYVATPHPSITVYKIDSYSVFVSSARLEHP